VHEARDARTETEKARSAAQQPFEEPFP
jgi:hypothetical protein